MYWYGFWWLFPERLGRRVKCYTRYLVTQNEGSWSCPLPEAEPEASTEAREAGGAGEGGSIPTPASASPYTGHYTLHWFTFPQSTNTGTHHEHFPDTHIRIFVIFIFFLSRYHATSLPCTGEFLPWPGSPHHQKIYRTKNEDPVPLTLSMSVTLPTPELTLRRRRQKKISSL